jgi:hypothetical protein
MSVGSDRERSGERAMMIGSGSVSADPNGQWRKTNVEGGAELAQEDEHNVPGGARW